MSLGEKAILTIPANLAYGQTGEDSAIREPTNEALVNGL
jgi:FKBP-type peptidyl-prolyl cis-trans isomerase